MARAKKEERIEEILEAGLEVFAERGYYNTTTADIAEKAGISQPYVFRFFKTKEDLFIAALDRAFARILQAFKEVKEGSPQLVAKMIETYEQLSISHPNEIKLQVIGLSVPEQAIRQSSKQGLLQIRSYVLERCQTAGLTHAEREVTTFLARGMLCNIAFFMDCPELIAGQKGN
ncbi:TetR family transcriptional regulator [Pullulanibacillus camelliae]|uniref:TetR family transcriptional regulator n=1 Tax=Pullulanibacillus camelliae TaxID=1707096 RepID=A0A8J2YD63_9BACL|nr:TetR/AcrR family transcriptional regulator [Pullulanibacillus camelliae]GGE32892.1 TetR family transcriptional regulator [Pullulanibacillus camelliae]